METKYFLCSFSTSLNFLDIPMPFSVVPECAYATNDHFSKYNEIQMIIFLILNKSDFLLSVITDRST